MGKKLLDYWMRFDFIDVLIGRIPSFNKKALRFVKTLGFHQVGEIPCLEKNLVGDRVSAVILYYSRLEHGRKI
jgi:hypothetical protein